MGLFSNQNPMAEIDCRRKLSAKYLANGSRFSDLINKILAEGNQYLERVSANYRRQTNNFGLESNCLDTHVISIVELIHTTLQLENPINGLQLHSIGLLNTLMVNSCNSEHFHPLQVEQLLPQRVLQDHPSLPLEQR
jgi:hypothetical protein